MLLNVGYDNVTGDPSLPLGMTPVYARDDTHLRSG